MLTTPTLDKLKALRFATFAAAWEAQQADPEVSRLSFDERLAGSMPFLVEKGW